MARLVGLSFGKLQQGQRQFVGLIDDSPCEGLQIVEIKPGHECDEPLCISFTQSLTKFQPELITVLEVRDDFFSNLFSFPIKQDA